MARTQSSGLVPWLLLSVVALIAYGSLYPFDFHFSSDAPSVAAALRQLSWARAGHSDRVRNVLLYVPLGFCLMLWLRPRLQFVVAVLVATLLGALLSLSIELAQVYLSIRVPSLLDITFNTVGTLAGTLVGVVWRGLSVMDYTGGSNARGGDRGALLLLVVWVLWRVADFNLSLSLSRLKLALRPLLEWDWSLWQSLRFLVLWLVVAQAVARYSHRQRSNELLLSIIATVLVGRLLLVTPAFIASELLALVLLMPTLVLLHKLRTGVQRMGVLAAFIGLFLYECFMPWQFGAIQHGFDFWPFMSWLHEGMPIHIESLLGKAFMFGAFIWLLKDAGLPMQAALLLLLVTVLGIEVIHLWQSQRSSSLTDPALALLVGLLLRYVSEDPRRKRRLRY